MKPIGIAQSSLATRFAVAVCCISLFAGVTSIGLLLLANYFHSRNELQETLERVHAGSENILVTSLWLTNDDTLAAAVNGLIAVSWIEKVKLEKADGTVVERGTVTSKRTMEHAHDLTFRYQDQPVHLGRITITAGLDKSLKKGIADAITAGLPLLFLTVFGGVFSFLFFHLLIGRHLQRVADFSESLNLGTLDTPLVLGRQGREHNPDELDRIVSALNTMRLSVSQALAEVNEHAAKYEVIVNRSSDAIVCIDHRYRLAYANPTACRLLRRPDKALRNMPFGELGIPEEMTASLRTAVERVIQKGVGQELSLEFETGQGKRFYEVHVNPNRKEGGQVVSVVAIARDITNRKTSEFMLREAFQHVPMLMTISDIETGRYLEVNDRFVQSTGYTREQAVGTSSIDLGFISASDRQQLKRILQDQGYIEDMELELVHADGSRMNCIYSAQIIAVDQTKVLLSMAYDITNQKESLRERENLERQLQHAMKMEAIGTLAAGIAHDFNNILGAIIGYGELALEDASKGSPLREDLNQIIQAGLRASELTRQILAFSRQEHYEFRPVRLQPLIKEVAKLLSSALPTTISLQCEVDEYCGPVLGDAIQLHQVLMNLCTNARHAIGNAHGQIDIVLRQTDIAAHELYAVDGKPLAAGVYLELIIKDSGVGMTPEIQARIFDPFFTTRGKEHGTGLGLSVTHGIVSKHQGAILVESFPKAGTLFHVFLPVTVSTVVEKGGAGKENLEGNEHVLLVDDEVLLVDIIDRALKKLGYLVTSFTSSSEALAYLHTHAQDIDLLVTDMTMPGMTGMALIAELHALRPNLPAILCTGYSEAIDRETALREGANAFLLKPIAGKDVARAIRDVLDGQSDPKRSGLEG